MSKSKKNVIDPEYIIKQYGADTARLFMLSDSPPERDINWSIAGINGAWKFTQKFWRTISNCSDIFQVVGELNQENLNSQSKKFQKRVHQLLKSITDSIESFQMNVAVARLHKLTSEIASFHAEDDSEKLCLKNAIEILIKVSEPIMPHLAEECWHQIGHTTSLIEEKWPKVNFDLLTENECVLVIQINGKKRADIKMPFNSAEQDVFENAINLTNIQQYIRKESSIKKKIFVPNKILNIVI